MFDNVKYKKDYDFGREHGYKVQGLVSFYIETASIEKLKQIICDCKINNVKLNPCGGGSNTLVKDKFSGTFVRWTNDSVSIVSDDKTSTRIEVGAACTKSDLNDFCIENGFSGLEFWAGIPGFVGGGVAMNAGAYGKEIKDYVKEIFCVTENGVVSIKAKDLKWSYRKLELPIGAIITKVVFELAKSDPKKIKQLSDSYILDRQSKHPLEYPSCGSVFKNPSNQENGAWWFIKEAGLSGFSIGGAKVSEKHSNFIINTGKATATDVINLISEIKKRVKAKFNISLEEEIKIY